MLIILIPPLGLSVGMVGVVGVVGVVGTKMLGTVLGAGDSVGIDVSTVIHSPVAMLQLQ